MRDIWDRIEKWLEANAPEVLASLQPGADEQQITEIEDLIGARFPDDLRDSFRIHNGQADDAGFGFVDSQELLSLERIRDEWSVWKELLDNGDFDEAQSAPQEGVRSDWWNPLWIPLTYDGGGNHYCSDLGPSSGGTRGQIITMWHDDAEREILAPSFRSWLDKYADDLEQGKILFSDEY